MALNSQAKGPMAVDPQITSHVILVKLSLILVPRAQDPSDLRQGSRVLAGSDFLSMRRVFVSYSQPIRFARFDGKSVNRGLAVLDQVRLELSIPAAGQRIVGSEDKNGFH